MIERLHGAGSTGANRSLDRVVDRICVERGWATREQVVACLLELRTTPGGAPEGLSNLLVSKGFVDRKALEDLSSKMAPLFSSTGPYDRIRRLDERMGDTLILAGEATKGQVNNALLRQESQVSQAEGPSRLSILLLERGDVSLTALEQAFESIQRDPPTRVRARNELIPEEVRDAASDPRNLMGKYVAVREIGRGSMGVVVKAWDTELHRWVALKRLTGAVDEDAVARFRREARTVASIRHPNIAGVYDIFTDNDRYVLALEYITGTDLSRRRLAPRKAAALMAQIARALEHVHSLDVVHRDIKPQNILIDAKGKPYLMDFGIAKQLNDRSQATTMGIIIGTPNYMPPEQAEGDSRLIGPWTDIYSLGAVLYELLTGRPPFDGRDDFAILHKVQNQPLTPPSHLVREVPAALEAIVLGCMEKDPENRISSARALASQLEAYATEPAKEAKAPVSRFRRLLGGLRKGSSS